MNNYKGFMTIPKSWMDIVKCKIKKKLFSGGGSYDEEGNEIKIGKWIELSDIFD